MAYEFEARVRPPKKSYRKGDLPETTAEWVSYVNRIHDEGIAAKHKYTFTWVMNYAYYLGYQNLLYNTRTGLLELPRDHRSPLTVNRIGSFVEARHAKLTKQRPTPHIIPESNDQVDILAAKSAESVLQHFQRATQQEAEHDKLTTQTLVFGNAFKENLWDPVAGDTIKEPKKSKDGEELVLTEEGEIDEDEIFLGEVSSRCVSPFDIIPSNDMIAEVPDQDWMLKRSRMSVAHLEGLYKKLRGKIPVEEYESLYTEHERILHRLSSPVFHMVGRSAVEQHDCINSRALVKTLFVKPNYQYEQGVVVVVIGKECAVLDTFQNDYGDNVYPWVKFSERKSGLTFWNQSTIERLIPIQRGINQTKQHKHTAMSKMSSPKWLLAKGSQVMDEAITDETGEIIEYNPSVPEPHMAQIAPLPHYVMQHDQDLVNDFREVGGQRESPAALPPGVTAGSAMQILAEISDESLQPILRRFGHSMEIDASMQLLLIDQEYDFPRLIKILGDDGKVRTEWFVNADLRHHTDVRIEIESMFPDFRATKRQTLLDLWDRRLVTDPNKVLKAFRYGSWDALLEDQDRSEEVVQLGIEQIKRGKMPEIQPFDDHMKWVAMLTAWIQTPEFLRLIPDRKQQAVQLLQMHTQLLIQQMPQQPMMQQNPAAIATPAGAAKPVGAEGATG